jgi:uncharacterized membrane protein
MLDTIEEWLSLIIGMVFVGFVLVIIALIFRSSIVWICLGLLAGLLFFFPIIRSILTIISVRRSRRRQDNEIERQRSQKSGSNQEQRVILASKPKQLSAPKSKPKQLTPEVKKPSLDDPEVQTYVPPGLPPELFL